MMRGSRVDVIHAAPETDTAGTTEQMEQRQMMGGGQGAPELPDEATARVVMAARHLIYGEKTSDGIVKLLQADGPPAIDAWDYGDEDCRGTGNSAWHKAADEFRDAVTKLFRRSWRLRRLLNFARSVSRDEIDNITLALFGRWPRRRREKLARMMPHLAEQIAPPMGRPRLRTKRGTRRGHPVTYDQNFVAEVDGWRNQLRAFGQPLMSSAYRLPVRVHLINNRNPRDVPIKAAIVFYLRHHLQRDPTPNEVASHQARYSQLKR